MGVYGYNAGVSAYPNAYGASAYSAPSAAIQTSVGGSGYGYYGTTQTGFINPSFGLAAMPTQQSYFSTVGLSYPQTQSGSYIAAQPMAASPSFSAGYQTIGSPAASSMSVPMQYGGSLIQPFGAQQQPATGGLAPQTAQAGGMNPFMAAPSMAPQTASSGLGALSAQLDGSLSAVQSLDLGGLQSQSGGGDIYTQQAQQALAQLPSKEELLQMLQAVDALERQVGGAGGIQSHGAEYPMMDDAMMGYEDPSIMGYEDPMMDGYLGSGGYASEMGYEDPFMAGMPSAMNTSLYSSDPLDQAVQQYRDTMRPDFAMGGALTSDAQDASTGASGNGTATPSSTTPSSTTGASTSGSTSTGISSTATSTTGASTATPGETETTS